MAHPPAYILVDVQDLGEALSQGARPPWPNVLFRCRQNLAVSATRSGSANEAVKVFDFLAHFFGCFWSGGNPSLGDRIHYLPGRQTQQASGHAPADARLPEQFDDQRLSRRAGRGPRGHQECADHAGEQAPLPIRADKERSYCGMVR